MTSDKEKWISVEERLPEKPAYRKTYLTTISNGTVIPMDWVRVTIRGKETLRWEYHWKISPFGVTHWMPLPEAPTQQSNEKT